MSRLAIDWIERMAQLPHTRSLLPRAWARGIGRLIQARENSRSARRALDGRKANLDTIEAFLLERAVRVRAPVALISQAHRSGGTLLSQLFDGHSQIAAHPHELRIGYPSDENWPPVEAALGADVNLRMLFDLGILSLLRNGYRKGNRNCAHPFFIVPRLQQSLFRRLFETAPPTSRRDILDHYFTAYFNSWLNYQGNFDDKRWITAFAPRLANHEASVSGFFDSYPDGRLIQVLRDPYTWYPSALRHRNTSQRGTAPAELLEVWCNSAEAMLRNKTRYGSRVIVLRFDHLVGHTEATGRALAHQLDIVFEPILIRPTFNGLPMSANSSFAVEMTGVIAAPLDRSMMLSDQQRLKVQQRCGDLYDRTLAVAIEIVAPASAESVLL